MDTQVLERNDISSPLDGRGSNPRSLANLKPIKPGEVRNPRGIAKKPLADTLVSMLKDKNERKKLVKAILATAQDSDNPRQVSAFVEIRNMTEGAPVVETAATASVTINMPNAPRPTWTRALEAADAQVIENKVDE